MPDVMIPPWLQKGADPAPMMVAGLQIGQRIAAEANQANQAAAALAQRAQESEISNEMQKRQLANDTMLKMQQMAVEQAYRKAESTIAQQTLEQRKQSLAQEATQFTQKLQADQQAHKESLAERQAETQLKRDEFEAEGSFVPRGRIDPETKLPLFETSRGRWYTPAASASGADARFQTTTRNKVLADQVKGLEKAKESMLSMEFQALRNDYIKKNPKASDTDAISAVNKDINDRLEKIRQKMLTMTPAQANTEYDAIDYANGQAYGLSRGGDRNVQSDWEVIEE